jgi:hypothetical protein
VTQANGRERALDGVGGPQVSPALCGEVIEGEVVSGHLGIPLGDFEPGAIGHTTRRAASVPGTDRMRTAAKGERSASGLARTLTRPVPDRDRAVTGTRWGQRNSDEREIPSCRPNSPDVPVQPRNPVSVRGRSRVVLVNAYGCAVIFPLSPEHDFQHYLRYVAALTHGAAWLTARLSKNQSIRV